MQITLGSDGRKLRQQLRGAETLSQINRALHQVVFFQDNLSAEVAGSRDFERGISLPSPEAGRGVAYL